MKKLGTMSAYALLCGISVLPTLARAEGWNLANDPANMVPGYNASLAGAPTAAELAEPTWDETFWPTLKGGIAYRWNWGSATEFRYQTFTEAQVRAMTIGDRERLSPAEKYDIYMGDFSYPTVRDQLGRKGAFTASWSGICDGWSASAVNYREPGRVTLTGASGIEVPFGSSDIKGLLSFNYSTRQFRPALRVGSECTRFKLHSSGYCKDVNAGSFHLVLTNKIALRHEGFVAEIDPGTEVWNQPVYKYSFRILETVGRRNSDSARNTQQESLIEMKMTYPEDDENDAGVHTVSHMNPTNGTEQALLSTKTYYYWVELDGAGNIIGGQWTNSTGAASNSDHPDFLWTPNQVPFEGYYTNIGTIYNASRAQRDEE